MSSASRLESTAHPVPAVRSELTGLLAAAVAADGARPVSEQGELRLRPETAPDPAVTHLLAYSDTELVGYAQLDAGDPETAAAELVVHPAHRRQGHGRTLLDRVRTLAPGVRVWAHGGHPGAAALATAAGMRQVRELLRMGRSLPADGLADAAAVPLGPGLRLRPFVPGRDEEAWVALNALAFADHPEQGRLTLADLRARMAEEWFEAAGFLLAESTESRGQLPAGALAGFHWTKTHRRDARTGGPVGEVYAVGVHPGAQGRGLGRSLTAAGLGWLASTGLKTVMLYVEADNGPALRVYTGLGFQVWDRDTMYR